MKRALLERNLVIVLFVLVLVVFSFAERDSKKLEKIYTAATLLKNGTDIAFLKTPTAIPVENRTVLSPK